EKGKPIVHATDGHEAAVGADHEAVVASVRVLRDREARARVEDDELAVVPPCDESRIVAVPRPAEPGETNRAPQGPPHGARLDAEHLDLGPVRDPRDLGAVWSPRGLTAAITPRACSGPELRSLCWVPERHRLFDEYAAFVR